MSYFITLEGGEGVGKSTAVQFLQQILTQLGINHICTREPGGTALGESIRQILLTPRPEPITVDAELLLLFAARAQHIAQVIRPALAKDQWVISDRFTDASFAYQGGGRQISMTRIAALARYVQGDLTPDLTLLLDAPLDLTMQRVNQRGEKDRFEQENKLFFDRVRHAYLDLAKAEPQRFVVIDASQSLLDVQAAIRSALKERLGIS
jgi:dTMP kinase